MGLNDRYTAEEDQRLTEYVDNRLWAARVPEEEWDQFRSIVFTVRNAGYGAPIEALISAMQAHGLRSPS